MSDNEISVFLTSLLIVMIVVLVGLVVAYVVIMMKTSNKKKKDKKEEIKTKEKAPTVSNLYNKQSIFDFMNFEKIEDSYIIRVGGDEFVIIALNSNNEQFIEIIKNTAKIISNTKLKYIDEDV